MAIPWLSIKVEIVKSTESFHQVQVAETLGISRLETRQVFSLRQCKWSCGLAARPKKNTFFGWDLGICWDSGCRISGVKWGSRFSPPPQKTTKVYIYISLKGRGQDLFFSLVKSFCFDILTQRFVFFAGGVEYL